MGGSRSHSEFFVCWKIVPKCSPKLVLIFWSMCILSVYILLKVVGYYDLRVLSMSVFCFQKKLDGGGWLE